jgi:hypothetical protein
MDESSRTIFETTQDGSLVSTVALTSDIKHPEAVAYDASSDTFYVSGFTSADIYEVNRDGEIVDTIKTLRDYRNEDGSHVAPKGLELVPDGQGGTDLWVADYGADQVDDGRVFVLHLEDTGIVWA